MTFIPFFQAQIFVWIINVTFPIRSLNALEDQDSGALMVDLVAGINEAEQRTVQAQKESSQSQCHPAPLEVSHFSGAVSSGYGTNVTASSMSQYEGDLPPPQADPMLDLPPPPPPPEPLSQVSAWGHRWQDLCNPSF